MSRALLINLSFLIPQPTGLATYAQQLLPHLRDLDPKLLIPEPIDTWDCHPVPAGMTSDRGAKGHLKRLLWTQWRLPRRYQRLGASLLFSPIPEAPLWSPCRTVITAHDLIPLRFSPPRSRLRFYFRHYVPRVLEQAEHILCNSDCTANDLMAFFQIPASKLSPIPLAHDRNRFRFLDLPTEPYFLYVGRNDPYKNLPRAIAAFGQFCRTIPTARQVEFWIAGPGDRRYHSALEQQVMDLGLTDRVKFLGYVAADRLPILLNQTLALVFPSLWEGFGLPLLEAMACGAPVLAGRRASLPEVGGDAVHWCDVESPDDLARAMADLATDDDLRQQLRDRGLARSQQFSWETTGRATADLLTRFL
ncbi:MAG: glycosyltransferase family 1 protein [Cyanophyceae cyanobacterium]